MFKWLFNSLYYRFIMLLYKGLFNMYLNYFNQQIDGIIV